MLNPGFEDPSNPLNQWMAINGDGFNGKMFQTLTPKTDDPRSKTYFYGYRIGNNDGYFHIRQNNIAIPDGTKVTCNAWVMSNRGSDTVGYTTFSLQIISLLNYQTWQCGTTLTAKGNTPWTRIGTGLDTITVKGTSFLLKLFVQTQLGDSMGASVGIDDVFVGIPPPNPCAGN